MYGLLLTSLPLSKTLWQPHNQLNRSHTVSLLTQNLPGPPSLIKLKSKLLLYLMLPYVLLALHVGCSSTDTELGMTFQVHLPPLLPSLPVPPASVTLASLWCLMHTSIIPQGLCAAPPLLEYTYNYSVLIQLLSFSLQHSPLDTSVCCLLSS